MKPRYLFFTSIYAVLLYCFLYTGSASGQPEVHPLATDNFVTEIIDIGRKGFLSYTAAINEAGDIVGSHVIGDAVWGVRSDSFLWQNGTVTSLDPGAIYSTPIGINNNGQILIAWIDHWCRRGHCTIPPYFGGYIWNNGIVTSINVGYSHDIRFTDINDNGQVIGTYHDDHDLDGTYRPFLWQDGKVIDTLCGPPTRINNNGQVVGSCNFYYNGNERLKSGYLWEDGKITYLLTFEVAYGAESEATDLNDSGQVIGRLGKTRGFLWQTGVMTDLGTLGGDVTNVKSINNRGQVVGDSTTTSGKTHAFLWENGKMVELETPIDADFCYVSDINDRGQIVGVCGRENLFSRPVMWIDGAAIDLGLLTDATQGRYGGFGSAGHINESGQVIGIARTAGGEQHAMLWKTNAAPDCSEAYPSLELLWPAKHQFVPVSVLGVTDPNKDDVAMTIVNVMQDEAVDAPGSGATSPDAKGIGTATALLRAERVASEDGRVYTISFTATDEVGATCSGIVRIGVPVDRLAWQPVYSGLLADSSQSLPGTTDPVSPFIAEGDSIEELLLPIVRH